MARLVGVCLVAAIVLGLSACDVGPVVLQGTLTHPDTGEALADVPVRVYSSTEETVLARGRTGEDGTYRFQAGSLPAGTYRVVFSADHWWESGTSWDTATDVTISSGEVVELDASLVPTTAILWGEVILPDGGPPSSDSEVDVYYADTGEFVASVPVEDWSLGDPSGDTCHSILSWGCYEIELPAGDVYAVFSPDMFDWGHDGDGDFAIELPSDGRRVDLHRTPYAALDGRVVDGGGAPIVGARVSAIPVESPRPPHLQEQVTGADGTFGLRVEPVGPHWLLLVGPDGTATLAGMVDGDPATATEFSVGVDDNLHIGDVPLVP